MWGGGYRLKFGGGEGRRGRIYMGEGMEIYVGNSVGTISLHVLEATGYV